MTEPLRRRFTSALGVFALVALVSTACSAGDPEPPPPTSTWRAIRPTAPGLCRQVIELLGIRSSR